MKKILAVLAFVALGVLSGVLTGQPETRTQSNILVSENFATGNITEYSHGHYVKDNNVNLCYFVSHVATGGSSVVVPCDTLKYYFGDK